MTNPTELSARQKDILHHEGTEPPFSSLLNNEKGPEPTTARNVINPFSIRPKNMTVAPGGQVSMMQSTVPLIPKSIIPYLLLEPNTTVLIAKDTKDMYLMMVPSQQGCGIATTELRYNS